MKSIIIIMSMLLMSITSVAQLREIYPLRSKGQGQVVDNAASFRFMRIPSYVSPTLSGYMDYVGQAFALSTGDTTLAVSLGNGDFARFPNKLWVLDAIAAAGGGSASILAGRGILYDSTNGTIQSDTSIMLSRSFADLNWWKIGGNTVTTDQTIGTNSNHRVGIKTGGVTRAIFGTAGELLLQSSAGSYNCAIAASSGLTFNPTTNGKTMAFHSGALGSAVGNNSSYAGYVFTGNTAFSVSATGIKAYNIVGMMGDNMGTNNSEFHQFSDLSIIHKAAFGTLGTGTINTSFHANPTLTTVGDYRAFWARYNGQWGFYQDGANTRNMFKGITYMPYLETGDNNDSLMVVSDSGKIKKIAQPVANRSFKLMYDGQYFTELENTTGIGVFYSWVGVEPSDLIFTSTIDLDETMFFTISCGMSASGDILSASISVPDPFCSPGQAIIRFIDQAGVQVSHSELRHINIGLTIYDNPNYDPDSCF